MADWDYIECGFKSADETINFGTRNIAGLDNLYETSTLAFIKNSGENTKQHPNILSSVQNESVFFAINKRMRAFSNLQCTNIDLDLTFDDEIDCFCVTSVGNYLLLYLRNGNVYCFEMGDEGNVICAENIEENTLLEQPFFIKVFQENQTFPLSFLAILRNGKVYRITLIETLNAHEDSKNSPMEFKIDLLININTSIQSVSFMHPTLVLTGQELHVYNVRTNELNSDDVGSFKKIFPCNSRMFLGLSKDGQLIHFCTNTFLCYALDTDTLYEDILLIHDSNNSHFLGLTKKNELGQFHLQLLSYPEYSITFSLKMSGIVHLITPECIHDEIIYISEVRNDEMITELRFQAICETMPENRLARLLRRKKFEEAEQFARLFHLDLSDIQKAKAKTIVDQETCSETDINNLLNILDTIADELFKIECCLDIHVSCSSFEDVKKILHYGYGLVFECNKVLSKDALHYQECISDLMFRFNTYITLIRCTEGNRKGVQDWVEFSMCNLIDKLYVALENENIEKFMIIYSRLDTKTSSELCEVVLKQILELLSNLKVEQQFQVLNMFLPLTLSYLPSSINMFMRWILEKVFHTETKSPNDFPDNAISFLNKMAGLLKIDCYTSINLQQSCTVDQNCLQQLADLYQALIKLKLLKSEYRIIIPLQQFLHDKKTLMEVLMNRVIYNMENEPFLEEFIRKFVINKEMEPDEILMDVVKDIIKYTEDYWIKTIPIILNSISSINIKLEATLMVLKAAQVPWCQTIHKIAKDSLAYTHPIVKQIMQEIEYEPKCVVLRKESYKLNKQYINTIEYLKFAINRIIYCNQPTMVEDVYQICNNPQEKHEANLLLINHFIREGKFQNALDILDNNSSEEVLECCKVLVEIATPAIENKYEMDDLQENYYHIIGSIFRRLLMNSSKFEKHHLKNQLGNLQNVYHIHKKFNLNVTLSDLLLQDSKNEILAYLINFVNHTFQETNNLVHCINECKKLATYLQLDESVVLVKLCEGLRDFNMILAAAKHMYESDADSQFLCKVVVLMLKHIGFSNSVFDNSSQHLEISFLKNDDNVDVHVFTEALTFAEKIVGKAILKCPKDQLGNCVELADWIQATYYLRQHGGSTYCTDFALPSVSALNGIKYVFQFYSTLLSKFYHPNTRYLMYFNWDIPKLNETQLTNEIQRLQSTIKCLCTEGHAVTAYKLLHRLQKGLVYDLNIRKQLQDNLHDLIKQSVKQLLHNVFSARNIDMDFAYNLLLSYDVNAALNFLIKTLKLYKTDTTKFKTIAQVYLHFLQYHKIEEGQILCRNIIFLSKWWKKIKNCQISYQHFFTKPPKEVLEKLIKFHRLNVSLIEEFCADFKLDVQTYYKLYLKNLLINWKAEYIIQDDVYGKRQLFMKNNEEQLLQDCLEVLNMIEEKESVYDMMNIIWSSINFYHYEVFVCILHILPLVKPNTESGQKELLLKFLKNYNRVSKPGQTEMEEWFTFCPDMQSIDPLSEWRLPYTPTLFTNKIWNIIRPEINLKTYSKWFEAISILRKYLNKDDICSFVIKDIVCSGVFQQGINDEKWILHARHNDLLEKIEKCVQHITNMERATSAVYCLATNIPGGADQVNAITLCYKYALLYQKQGLHSEDSQKAVIKVTRKYFSFCTTHILHVNGLADNKYLEMVSHPVRELIETLYMDDRILKKATSITLRCPDINKAIDELAELHNINIQEMRFMLLNNWLLASSATDFMLDTSMCMHTNSDSPSKQTIGTQSRLLRAAYVCSSGDVSHWQMWLLKEGQLKKNDTGSLSYKVNALRCFANISDMETIENLMNCTYEEFRNFINKITLMSGLECFGFSLDVESLDKCNKNELLSRLAYHISSPLGVQTMASVCITYAIEEFKYWNVIINAMLKLNMVQELKECIVFLKKYPLFNNRRFYVDAWQAVINDSFNIPINTIEDKLNCLLTENFYFIQSCPVLHAIDLEYVTKKCVELRRYDFALLAVQYLTKEQYTLYLKELLQLDQNVDIKLEQLSKYGFWGISYVKSLLNDAVNSK